jgi:adenosylcobinamide-GDP ribazoletransferase
MATTPIRSDPEPRRSRLGRALAARWRELVAAIGFLTRAPIGKQASPEEIARGVVFFPPLGIALGLIAGWVAGALGPGPAVAVLALASSAQFQLAPAATATALVRTRGDRAEALRTLRELAVGAPGWIALVLLLALKVAALALVAVGSRALALMLAALLGRWAVVVQAYGSLPAQPAGLPPPPISKLQFHEFAIASVIAMGLTLMLADAAGLVLLLIVGAEAIVLRILVHRWLGGVTGETSVAGGEIVEATVLVCCAALSALQRA